MGVLREIFTTVASTHRTWSCFAIADGLMWLRHPRHAAGSPREAACSLLSLPCQPMSADSLSSATAAFTVAAAFGTAAIVGQAPSKIGLLQFQPNRAATVPVKGGAMKRSGGSFGEGDDREACAPTGWCLCVAAYSVYIVKQALFFFRSLGDSC